MERMTRRLLHLLEGLNKEQKVNYYRVCGIADRRLVRHDQTIHAAGDRRAGN